MSFGKEEASPPLGSIDDNFLCGVRYKLNSVRDGPEQELDVQNAKDGGQTNDY